MIRNLLWVYLFLALTIITLSVVPKRQISRLLPTGVVAGALLAFVVQLIGVRLLRLWSMTPDVFTVLGIPLFSALAWIPSVITFSYFLTKLDNREAQIAYVSIFTLATALVTWEATNLGMRNYIRWNFISDLGLVGLLYSAIAYYIYETRMTDIDELH